MRTPPNAQTLELEERLETASAVLRQFPRHPNGLTPDHIKFSPEYRKAKADVDAAFAALRTHNKERCKR